MPNILCILIPCHFASYLRLTDMVLLFFDLVKLDLNGLFGLLALLDLIIGLVDSHIMLLDDLN